MKTLATALRRTLVLTALPAVLAFAGCGKDDDPVVTPAPEQGRVSAFHMAASANVGVKVLVDDVDKATLTYGQNSGYQGINTGAHTLKVNVASSGANALTQALTVEKDKSYSYFAYANAPTTVAGLLIPDDLTAPSAGKAKIRFVHLGQGSLTPLKLSTTVASVADIANTETQFANASSFVEILPGSYNIAVTSGPASVVVTNVGDGSGSGTVANKTYESGKIYTVVLRGITGALVDPALQPKAVLIQNN
ncbi:protein of unknown function [Hymenobacter daecheongensis DSM 21074]|uniref:DUF4397 domain-containing protein n=1 Tax=Hymenobacter daecheongensis DSM 21074 TaxID=1121955 RepID=A0A1M6DF48_9BACT|nr:DUF4397 domain-containing protein [Hymenobacter daecheongensis]SHI71862.1 protein of unknown function [Hymenobacter daecheongensis DSM 21074]